MSTIRRKASVALVVLVAVLVALRVAAPTLVQRYVNRTLDGIPEYDGQIGDVDLHLWRGAYSIEDVSLVKTGGKVPVPLFKARHVDLSIRWGPLFHGSVVGEMILDEPELNFVSGPSKESSQKGVDASWIEQVKRLFPLRFDRVDIHRGTLHFRDFHTDPEVDLVLKDVEGWAFGLSNRGTADEALPAFIHVMGQPKGGGWLELDVDLDPLQEAPTFKLTSTLTDLPLPSLNDFLRAYGNIDAEGGTVTMYAELAGESGRFHGYVKPLLKDIVVARGREGEGLPRKVWEGLVSLAAKILKNEENQQVATRIPVEGTFAKAEPDTWAAIGGLLRNAFVQALVPGIEGSVRLPKDSKLARGSKQTGD